MSERPRGSEPTFLDELRAQLQRGKGWLFGPLIVVGVILLIVLIWGALGSLPFVYDIF